MLSSVKGNTTNELLSEHSLLGYGQFPRLVNMRLRRAADCSCERCTDLLSLLHNNEALLLHTHMIEQWGLKHWLNALDVYQQNGNAVTHAFPDYDLDTALDAHERCVDLLLEAEQNWRTSNGRNCNQTDTDDVWTNHFRKVKLVCADFRKGNDDNVVLEEPCGKSAQSTYKELEELL